LKTHVQNLLPQPEKLLARFFGLLAITLAFTILAAPAQEGQQEQTSETSSESTNTQYDSSKPEESSQESGKNAGDIEERPLIDPDSTLYKAVKYTGKFHIMVLHFPIAFLIGAAVVQWYLVARGKGASVVAVMLWFGALGAVAAATLGWMYAYDSVYFGEEDIKLLFWHRWLGTGTAVLALVVLSLRKKLGPKSLAVALTLCVGLVAAAAHFGASLVYGPEFLLKF
jgi:hypothetical protein